MSMRPLSMLFHQMLNAVIAVNFALLVPAMFGISLGTEVAGGVVGFIAWGVLTYLDVAYWKMY